MPNVSTKMNGLEFFKLSSGEIVALSEIASLRKGLSGKWVITLKNREEFNITSGDYEEFVIAVDIVNRKSAQKQISDTR